MRLYNKIAMITGAGQGLGAGMAYRFAQEGAKVVVVDVNEEKAMNVQKEISENNGTALALTGDVANYNGMRDLVQKVIEEYGTIDILVNNAGITRDSLFHKMTEEKWDQVITINLKGVFNCCQAVVPIMREKAYGKIINISSAARFGNVGQVNYSSSKAGLVGLTRALAKELASKGITVNAVAPGFIKSEMSASVPEDIIQRALRIIPMSRQGTVEDVVNAVLFFSTDDSSFITGQTIQVDGGLYMY